MNVRLSPRDIDILQRAFRATFPAEDHLWLFGSRVDLNKRGGDIDLYIETHQADAADAVRQKSQFLVAIFRELEEQKIDVVLNRVGLSPPLPIYAIARQEGVLLV